MLPEIHFFSLTLSSYGIMASIGLIAMFITAVILGRRRSILIEDILFGELSALVGAFLGAHILYGITNIDKIIYHLGIFFRESKDFDYLLAIITSFLGGMVFYGGLIGGLLSGALYCKIRKIDVGEMSDCFAVAIPLFHAIARVGCFLGGCCYGIPSKHGFVYTHSLTQGANFVSRFPVQLLESGLNLIFFAVLLILFIKGKHDKKLIYIYLIMYSNARFFDEFLRGDEYRGILFGLSTSQWISIILFLFSVIILIRKNKKEKQWYNLSGKYRKVMR